ncbi:MAG: redoxin family protein [Acidobacteriota bacterium]|nr:redoxin family protein [Acidobacteriota bacterium]
MSQNNDGKDEKGALRSDQNELINSQGFSFSGYERDPLYMNLDGKKFTDISGVSGIDSISDGRAGVFADFDNDGDLDVFVTTIQNQTHLLFRNNVGQNNNFLRIALEGDKKSGLDAFGAVVRVKTSAGTLTKIKSGGAGYISQHDPRLLFGLGKDSKAESIEVTWTNGKVERFTGEALAGSTLFLKQGKGKTENIKLAKTNLPDPLTKTEIFAKGLKIKVGKPLPDFALKKLTGVSSSMKKELKTGRKTLINIWATWCVPCATEMPELEKMRPKLAARGIDLIGLNVDAEMDADIKGYLAKKRITYPNLIGGTRAIEQIYATEELTVPLTILVDEKGIVTDLIPGWSKETQQKFAEITNETESAGTIPFKSPNK